MEFIRRTRPNVELEQKVKEEFPQFAGFDIRINFGSENKIRYVEEVITIPEVNDVLHVTLLPDGMEWLRDQLTRSEETAKDWVDESSFGDREAINERYGFTR